MTDISPSTPVTAETIEKDFEDKLLAKIKQRNPRIPIYDKDDKKVLSEETDFVVEYLLTHPGYELTILQVILKHFFEPLLLKNIICKLAALAGRRNSPDATAPSGTGAAVDAQRQAIGEDLLGFVAGK